MSEQDKCPGLPCDDDGMVDTGAQNQDGSWITEPCPVVDCLRRQLSHLRGQLAALQAENARLRAELASWPRVYWRSEEPRSLAEGYRVLRVDVKEDEFANITVAFPDAPDEEFFAPTDFGIYSTREAAEAAKAKGEAK